MLSIAMLIALELLRVKDLPIPLSIYAAVCMTISLAWFVKYRRRFG
jgi:hypothetical protein